MKCTNCGKNDVNFYYTSNINGKVTKQQLCTECAEKLGYTSNVGSMFERTEQMMNSMLGGFFGRGLSPFADMRLGVPGFMELPWFDEPEKTKDECCEDSCSCGKKADEKPAADPEIVKRREINALRHQMKAAAEAENFEEAARIRDRISEMENGK